MWDPFLNTQVSILEKQWKEREGKSKEGQLGQTFSSYHNLSIKHEMHSYFGEKHIWVTYKIYKIHVE